MGDGLPTVSAFDLLIVSTAFKATTVAACDSIVASTQSSFGSGTHRVVMARCRHLLLFTLVLTILCCIIPQPFTKGARNEGGGLSSPEQGDATVCDSDATCSGTEHRSETTPAHHDATGGSGSPVSRTTERAGVSRKLPAQHTHAPAAAVVQGQEHHVGASPATSAVTPMEPEEIVARLAAAVVAGECPPADSPEANAYLTRYTAAEAAATAESSPQWKKRLANLMQHFLCTMQSTNEITDVEEMKVYVNMLMSLINAVVYTVTAKDAALVCSILRVLHDPTDASNLKQLMSLTKNSNPELAPHLERLQELVPAQFLTWYNSPECTIF